MPKTEAKQEHTSVDARVDMQPCKQVPPGPAPRAGVHAQNRGSPDGEQASRPPIQSQDTHSRGIVGARSGRHGRG